MVMVEMPPTVADARQDLATEWNAAAPRTPLAVWSFYRNANGLRADLDAWHATDERRSWTKALIYVAKRIDAHRVVDIGCGAGHDLRALRDFGLEVSGVEPNVALCSDLIRDGISCDAMVVNAPIEDADLLVCIDVLEHVPDPESFLTAIARRAKLNAVLVETTATHDLGTPLHLPENRGWHPGRALESCGWTKIDEQGRLRVWQRMALQKREQASLILCAYRQLSMPTLTGVLGLVKGNWRILTEAGDALVSRVRSKAVSRWWRENADDVFLMADDDIVFDPSGADWLVKQCRQGHDIICAAYPVHNGAHFALRAPRGEIAFRPDAEPVEIEYAATGFLAVHRRVLDAMIPTLTLCHPDQVWSFWPMFQPMVAAPRGLDEYLSEDWAFCQRARDLGFKVWLDPSVRIGHLSQIELNVANMQAIHAALSNGA